MAKQGRRAEVQEAGERQRRLITGAVVVAVIVVGGMLFLFARPGPTEPLSETSAPVLGSEIAPVAVFYFGDFQCPACRAFEMEGLDAFRTEYVDTGRARLVFKNFPFLGEDSWTAAQASHFVWATAPEDYWAWHRTIYERQGPEGSGWASLDRLVEYSAAFPGIDGEAMRAAILAEDYLPLAQSELEEGRAHGVASTPTLVIGDQRVNANDVDAIRSALAEAGP